MTFDIRAVESLMAFWADAGVEVAYADEPVDRTVQTAALLKTKAEAPTGRRTVQAAPAPAARKMTFAAPVATPPPPAAEDARRLAAAAGDLDALAKAIADFDGCGLKFEGARQAVFSRGNPDAPVMIIGEGPGADEDAQGAPFVGRAGKLLDRMIAAAGLEDRVFITNTVFWRPPGNRTPSPDEQLACAPFLERAIALVKPKALLLAGGASAKSVLKQTTGILALRGRWFEWKSEDGSLEIPAMPTLHPAFLLRQPAAKKKAWEDFLTLTERVDRPDRPA
ncbi:MAG: uracil-DNA glycosylase [Proteobacteria bacterium]|nr:uracil-DNA glycosylase [Pseudomonadota bacterium]